MPKGDRKGNKGRDRDGPRRRRERDLEYDDQDDDAHSVASASTNSTLSLDSDQEECDEGCEVIDDTRSRIDEFITATEHKSSKIRESGVTSLCAMFSKAFLPDNIASMQETLLDTIQRLLRRGTDAEKTMACRLAGVLILQLGCSDEAKHYMEQLTSFLTTTLADHTKSQSLRAMCARVLAVGNFVIGDLPEHLEVASKFEAVLRPALSQSLDVLAGSVLTSWPCLVFLMPADLLASKSESLIGMVKGFLESKDPAVRIAAGEMIAVVYEQIMGAEQYSDYMCEDHDEITLKVKQLATDHSHRRSKAERKEGRASFRPVLAFLEEGESPEEKLIVCKRQTLKMTTWTELKRYGLMKDVLGSGVKQHLMDNSFVREVFGLGSPLGQGAEKDMYTREEKRHIYAATKMYRQQERSTCRGKRSAVF